MKPGYCVEPLGAHDRAGFSCWSVPLDRYLREQASQDVKRLVAGCFVALDEARAIAGYYTLSAASVPAIELPDAMLKRLPRHPVLPAALVGRLAVDLQHRGMGLGSALLADAAKRVLSGELTAFAMIVDAKDAQAASFYARLGFMPFASRKNSYFMPLASMAKAAKT